MPIPVASEAELLAAVPYLLGFQPRSSLVVLGLERAIVSHSMRLDLPQQPAHRRSWLAVGADAATRYQPDAVCLIGFDAGEQCGPLLRLLAGRLRRRGAQVAVVLLVGSGTWRHLDATVCPACPGHAPPDAGALAVAAEFVVRGRAPLPSRTALAATLAPDTAYLERYSTPDHATGQAEQERRVGRAEQAWHALTSVGRSWDPEPGELAALAASVVDADWRDALLAELIPGLLPAQALAPGLAQRAARACAGFTARRATPGSALATMDATQAVTDRIRLLARRSPGQLAAGPYAMLAVLAGCGGDGATAVLAAQQAIRAESGHVLATLILQLYACGRSLAPPDRMNCRGVG